MTPAEREALRALAAKATPLPWRDGGADGDDDYAGFIEGGDGTTLFRPGVNNVNAEADSRLACDAVNALPFLLSALSAAEAERDTWRSVANDLGAERDRLRERVRLAEAWLAADDAFRNGAIDFECEVAIDNGAEAMRAAREAFRASKGGE